MEWKPVNANISITYTSMTWERVDGGMVQRLSVMVWNDKSMTAHAEQYWQNHTRNYSLTLDRRYVWSQEEISELFFETFHKGDVQ